MKKIAILLITISLSVNAGWFWNDKTDDNDEADVYIEENILGAFGVILGKTYNQDFIKPYFDDGINNIVVPKPIKIFSEYYLDVDDLKSAFQIRAQDDKKNMSICLQEFEILKRALEKKYKFNVISKSWNYEDTHYLIIKNKKQNREISLSCFYGELGIKYVDYNILRNYQKKVKLQRLKKEDSRINIQDI